MKKILIFIGAVLVIFAIAGGIYLLLQQGGKKTVETTEVPRVEYAGKKIIVIDSYNAGYEGYELKIKGAKSVLDNTGVDLKIVHLDEKNNPDEEFQKQAAFKIKSVIESFDPDVIISLDDPAFKYVIMPYYKDSKIPVAFSGINWDASSYGAPYGNTAGMIEVALIDPLIDYLKNYSKGERISIIDADNVTSRSNIVAIEKFLGKDFDQKYYVKDFTEWKNKFIESQKQSDMLLLLNNAGIEEWKDKEAELYVKTNAIIPVGTYNTWMSPYALIGLIKFQEEQGEYAAKVALRILDGESPSEIGVVENKKGQLMLNLKIANKLNIVFTPAMIRAANTIIKEE